MSLDGFIAGPNGIVGLGHSGQIGVAKRLNFTQTFEKSLDIWKPSGYVYW
jgi:hypothetical protein